MRNQIIWQDRFNIGIDFIDREHKKLFSIINRLFIYKDKSSKSQWVCQEGIKYFKEHAMKHFTEEEAYMASINYPDFEMHRKLHDNFRKKTLPALERELVQTGYSESAVSHFLGVCAGWLIGHTLTEDQAISGDAVSRWSNILPEEEQSAMKQVIIKLLYDMFHLNAKIISDHYSGEKFGNGIYYRLAYSSKEGEEWEIILVFEEKLLVNTIGEMINDKSEEVNTMMVNITRYTAQQFVEYIQEHIPSAELSEIVSETLLTHEQLQRLFENKKPQCSFLFDTGAGYFAYCVFAPHLLIKGLGNSIKAENAMKEIGSYLDQKEKTEQNPRKKILIVDDSDVIRLAMKSLLGDDYEVSMAPSGLSAIRSIILNKPDLILLDYEMPVCDGRQVLEMIRSEQEMKDIPVIFLTGKGDKESIMQVMSLNPAGYLLKTLNPAEIKKNIDEYFKRFS